MYNISQIALIFAKLEAQNLKQKASRHLDDPRKTHLFRSMFTLNPSLIPALYLRPDTSEAEVLDVNIPSNSP